MRWTWINAGRGTVGKAAVVGARSRDGKVTATVVDDTTRRTLHGFIHDRVRAGSTVYTDGADAYRGLGKVTTSIMLWYVTPSGSTYAVRFHTNGVESFWSALKRGYYGTYHKMSFKHLCRYVAGVRRRPVLAGEDLADALVGHADEHADIANGEAFVAKQLRGLTPRGGCCVGRFVGSCH